MTEAEVQDRRVGELMQLMQEKNLLARFTESQDAALMAKQVAKKYAKEWPESIAKDDAVRANVLKTLGVMMSVQEVMKAAEQLYLVFLPLVLLLRIGSESEEQFEFETLDSEGRGIYRSGSAEPKAAYLRWVKSAQGGCWAAHTDRDGKEPGDLCLYSPLPYDTGVWQRTDGKAAEEVVCKADTFGIEEEVAQQLERTWSEENRSFPDVCKNSAEALQKSTFGSKEMHFGQVTTILKKLLEAMCDVVEKIDGGKPQKPKDESWQEIFSSLATLGDCSNSPVWPKLEKWMPAFDPEYPVTWVQCMVLTCRLLNVCDIRLPKASWLPRLCHRAFLRSWQDENKRKALVLDLKKREATVCEPGPKPRGTIRFVVISDTHGWDGDLRLPDGDVLLHCGDVLFEGAALSHDKGVPDDLQAVLNVFKRDMYKKFKWIILIGGNHDTSLHQLWAENRDELAKHLPDNLVLLQTPADLKTPVGGSGGLAKSPQTTDHVEDGAVRLLPDLSLCRPSKPSGGLVIAGSGVSLANNAWSANNAFQIPKSETDALAKAAEATCKHKPDIVMTHGPPKGHCDKGRGDAKLAEVIQGCQSVKVHLFGHVHETYGVEFGENCVWANAAMSSPLYVPAVEPMLFDLQATEVTSIKPSQDQIARVRGTRAVKLRGLPECTIPWEIFAHFPGTMVAAAVPPQEGSNEAVVFFELADHAAEALQTRWDKHFGKSGRPVALEVTEVPQKQPWVYLFDVLNTSKSGSLTVEEQQAGYDAGILPRERLYAK